MRNGMFPSIRAFCLPYVFPSIWERIELRDQCDKNNGCWKRRFWEHVLSCESLRLRMKWDWKSEGNRILAYEEGRCQVFCFVSNRVWPVFMFEREDMSQCSLWPNEPMCCLSDGTFRGIYMDDWFLCEIFECEFERQYLLEFLLKFRIY